MCITKARGPILLPWGTPPLILTESESTFSNFVTWDLSWRYDASQARTAGLTPIFSQFYSNLL